MSSTSPTEPVTPFVPHRSRRRVFLVRAVFVIALLGTLIAAWYAIERVRGRASWERYEAGAQAAGVKMTSSQYVPRPVPDADNFAAIPIFQEIFRAQAEHRQVPQAFEWPSRDRVPRASFADSSAGRLIDLAAWQKYFIALGMIPAAGSDPARDVLEALKKFEPELAQLREAGQRSGCYFPVHWEHGFATALPHVGLFNASARTYVMRLTAHLALGENQTALQDFRESLRVYTATAREPSLIAALVRITIPSLLGNAVWDGLARRQWKDADLMVIEKELRSVNALADYQLGIGSERALTNLFYPQLRGMGPTKIGELVSNIAADGDRVNALWRGRNFLLYPQGWIYRNQERTNRYLDDLMARISVDPPRVFTDRPMDSGPENVHGLVARGRLFFFVLAAPAFQPMEIRFANVQTLTDQVRLGCALERFRLARGAFPAQLAELVPEYLPSLPLDVMNGEPYRYRQGEGGYTLYSVASNLADDGGQTGSKPAMAKQLDWVWTMPAVPSPAK